LLLSGRQFPDKTIDLIDEACTTANLRKQNEVIKNVKENTKPTETEVTIIGAAHVARVTKTYSVCL
jgi:ATP-dependent Clp protease ATP-binding subunit ClpA